MKEIYYLATNTKNIWDIDEVTDNLTHDRTDDPRIEPEYEISYKQNITTEDIYLNTSNKNPATFSCKIMIVSKYFKIHLRINFEI